MQKTTLVLILSGICLTSIDSTLWAQTIAPANVQKVRPIIDLINKQFAQDFYNRDSIALAAHYTKDAQFGAASGKEILSVWSKMIKKSIRDNERSIEFTTTSLNSDSDLLVELGTFEIKDDKNNLKKKGRYLVVWKQENGAWKIYRDVGL